MAKLPKPVTAVESPGARLARLPSTWKAAFDALVAARVGFLALCVAPTAYGPRRERGKQGWRDAEATESAAAAAGLEVWTGGSGDGDAADTSEVEVDPAAALTFWKRADWTGYCGGADGPTRVLGGRADGRVTASRPDEDAPGGGGGRSPAVLGFTHL